MLLSRRKLRISLERQVRSTKKILYRSFVGMSFLAIICCGKKVEDSDKSSGNHRYDTPISTDLEQSLKDQQLSCEPGSVCPNYLGMIQVIDKGQIRTCTGFLVDKNIIATSSSCLPEILRLANQDCSNDVHFFFSSMVSDKTVRVGCDSVISASDLKSSNPVLWRDDIAYLKMNSSLSFRRTLKFSRKGFADQDLYTAWFISRMDAKTSFIKRETCKNIQSSYVNPFANNPSSPNILVSDCELSESASGAPLVDKRGEVRGVVSKHVNNSISEYLVKVGLANAPLKKMFHGTSYACAPTIYDSQVLDEVECLKDMGQVALDEGLTKVLEPVEVFDTALKELNKELNDQVPYMNFNVSLEGNAIQKALSFTPRCFKPLNQWIDKVDYTSTFVTDFYFPQTIVKKSLDTYGKLTATISKAKNQKFNLQFSTRNLKKYANSKVFYWNENFNFVYPRVTTACQ